MSKMKWVVPGNRNLADDKYEQAVIVDAELHVDRQHGDVVLHAA